jgi:hypothetical protein
MAPLVPSPADQATHGTPRNRLRRAAGVAPLEGAESRGSKPARAGLDGSEEPQALAAAPSGQRPILGVFHLFHLFGANNVPRQFLLPHQHGYSALSFLVYGSSIIRP